jgi:hypothetical protein
MWQLEIILTQPHRGSSRWKYEGDVAELQRQLRMLADDLDMVPTETPDPDAGLKL